MPTSLVKVAHGLAHSRHDKARESGLLRFPANPARNKSSKGLQRFRETRGMGIFLLWIDLPEHRLLAHQRTNESSPRTKLMFVPNRIVAWPVTVYERTEASRSSCLHPCDYYLPS